MKHEYSTLVLIGLLVLLVAMPIVALLDSEDIDEVCASNNAIMRRSNGTWNCSITSFGEVYYHHDSDALIVDIVNQSLFVQVAGFNVSNCRGILCDNESFTLDKNATYMIDSSMSITGNNLSEYHCALFKGAVEQVDCEGDVSMKNGRTNLGITCLKNGLPDEVLTLKCKDNTINVGDINIYSMNLNIVEVQ